MDVCQKKVYEYFKELLEFLEQNKGKYNSIAKKCSKEERKDAFGLATVQCKSIIAFLDGTLLKPGFYFYSLKTVEIFLKMTNQLSKDEINNMLYAFLESDIESTYDYDNKLFLTINSIYNFEQKGINIVSLKNDLEKYNKEMWPRIIMKLYPKQYEKILTILMSHNKLILTFQKSYQILKLHLFNKRKLNPEEQEEVKKALKHLEASDSFIEFCLSKKEKSEEIVTDKGNQSFKSFRPSFVAGFNEKEWKELENRLSNYYKDNPIHSLDIIEKIELITVLLQLEYSEDEIKKILHENDRQFYQEKITNQESDYYRNTRIVYLLMKNAYKNNKISQNITDCLDRLNYGSEKEKADWRELVIDLIEEESREYIKELKKMRNDIARMKLNEQKSFRDSYLDNLQTIYGNTYMLINQIREQYKKSTNNDKNKWKTCIHFLLKRLVLEQFGSYDFEIIEARRLVEKELQTRTRKI